MQVYPKRASLEGLEVEILKLVSYSATPDQWKEWLRVPLEHAAARGNLDLFNKLLGAGANGSAGWMGCRNRTLLDAAALGGNEEVVSGLLRVGAQPDVKVVSCSSGRSALYTATMLGHEAVARQLVIAGADLDFHEPVDECPVLHKAIWGGHKQLATDLLVGGANPNSRAGPDKKCPLHVAAANGLDGIVSTLLLRGADKDALDNHRRTPITWASNKGRLSVVKTLLAAGADVGIRDTDECSALDCAARSGYDDVIEAIVEHGADVNARRDDDTGITALHIAAQYDKAGAVDVLIEAGADIELKDGYGDTPLAIAAGQSCCKSMLALWQHGAKVDVRGNLYNTPLHEACSGRNEGVEAAVDLLLRWGADETALNNDGDSPAESLDVNNDEDVDNPVTQDEIDRTRLLLSRAPANRAWRRRGWLVMLRSRSEKASMTSCGSGSRIEMHGPGVADGRRDAEGCKAAKREQTEGVADQVARRATNTDVGASGSDIEGGVLGEVVTLVVEMEPEGMFRTIVGFL